MCVWNREVKDPVIFKLLHYLDLVEAGCPVGRHELLDFEWLAVGLLKMKRKKISYEDLKEKQEG